MISCYTVTDSSGNLYSVYADATGIIGDYVVLYSNGIIEHAFHKPISVERRWVEE